MVYIDKTSVVESESIGEGTKIWHFTHIMPGVVIGKGCVIGQNVFIAEGVKIGDGCKIQNNVSIFKGVKIEDDVFIGPSVVFTNVINPRAFINRHNEFKTTRICRGASIGANSTILCGIEIGEYAFVGAGSVVTKQVSPNQVVYGNPAKPKGYCNKEMRLWY